MRILHTSDLHLGRVLLEESLIDDQEQMLTDLTSLIKDQKVAAVAISGDIYDKSIPSEEAMALWDSFLHGLSQLPVEVLVVSGNHDSNGRLGYGNWLFAQKQIHIVTHYGGQISTVLLDGVTFYLLPFVKPFHLKPFMSEAEYAHHHTSEAMMRWLIERETLDRRRHNILLAHQFVVATGQETLTGESERATNLGTLDAIDASIFADFDYVALGHVHRPQKIGRQTVRYSGTPLAYAFSEASDRKSVVIYDTQTRKVELLPIVPKRRLQVWRGSFVQLMARPVTKDLLRFELTDGEQLLSPMQQLKKRFPGALSLSFVGQVAPQATAEQLTLTKGQTPTALFAQFFQKINQRPLTLAETQYLQTVIAELEGSEHAT